MERKKVGIIFSNDSNWIGGTYYLLNLVSSFLMLDDKDKPEVVIFSWETTDYEIVKKTGYPYLSFLNLYIPYTLPERILNKIFPVFFSKLLKKQFDSNVVDIIFPFNFQDKLKNISKKVFWVPDFQEFFYPEFFTKTEIEQRQHNQQEIAKQNGVLVLSSKSVQQDFYKIFPNAICPTKVINFAVTHPSYTHLDIDDLKVKFNIKSEYYFAPNQFWKHKNHLTVIKAVQLLKEQGHEVLIVFTGKEHDRRNPTYSDDLKEYVIKNNLSKNILFLGFIDRAEQLQLMNHAKAVIQPSLFEGWSTVVEDAKAMSQYIIASDIQVHREQLQNNCRFFSSKDEVGLAKILIELNKLPVIVKQKNDYTLNVKIFAESFLQLINYK